MALGIDQVLPRQRRQYFAPGIIDRAAGWRCVGPAFLIGRDRAVKDFRIEDRKLALIVFGIEIDRVRRVATELVDRQTVRPEEIPVDDDGVIAARIDALV